MTIKTERLEARIPAHLKADFKRAAAIQGQTLTEFILQAAAAHAREVIEENEILQLNRADQMAFAQALINPPAPNEALTAAARRFHDETK